MTCFLRPPKKFPSHPSPAVKTRINRVKSRQKENFQHDPDTILYIIKCMFPRVKIHNHTTDRHGKYSGKNDQTRKMKNLNSDTGYHVRELKGL